MTKLCNKIKLLLLGHQLRKKRHCPDLNQGSPVYKTGALTAKLQRHGSEDITFLSDSVILYNKF